MGKTHNKLCA